MYSIDVFQFSEVEVPTAVSQCAGTPETSLPENRDAARLEVRAGKQRTASARTADLLRVGVSRKERKGHNVSGNGELGERSK